MDLGERRKTNSGTSPKASGNFDCLLFFVFRVKNRNWDVKANILFVNHKRAMFNFYLLSNWKSNGETSSDIIFNGGEGCWRNAAQFATVSL